MWVQRSTGLLLYAALQFVVLTAIAMRMYPHHVFTENFFSDLGATRTWAGEPNPAVPLFVIALGSLGIAMVVFAATWRGFAFERRRWAGLGWTSQALGTLSGLAFVAVALTPVNVALDRHNLLVILAFGLLLAFAVSATLVWWRNGAPTGVLVAGALYVAVLIAFFVSAGWVVRTGVWEHRRVLIVGQKIAVYASMAYVVFVTLTIRRRATLRT